MLILVLPELFLSQNSCSSSSCQPLQNIWKLPMIVPKISCNSFTILSESLFLNFAMWSVTWPSEGPGFLFKQISILCHILPLNCLHYCFLFFGKIIWFEKKKGGGRGPSPLQQKSGKRNAGYSKSRLPPLFWTGWLWFSTKERLSGSLSLMFHSLVFTAITMLCQ